LPLECKDRRYSINAKMAHIKKKLQQSQRVEKHATPVLISNDGHSAEISAKYAEYLLELQEVKA